MFKIIRNNCVSILGN